MSIMKILYFLSEHVFRFRYRNSCTVNEQGNTVWDIGIHEEENEKMMRDFFLMGASTGLAICVVIGGAICWLV